jgi:7-carboxy-7-deazaguanine synthase (Cx14CxxC type)
VGIDGPGGGKFISADELATHAASFWPHTSKSKPYVVCTGGEPLLQMDDDFVIAFHQARFEIAIETNGTVLPPDGIDWICVSPKIGSELIVEKGQELKLVYPQNNGDPKQFENLDFEYFSLQPMDGPNRAKNTDKTLFYCRTHPHWRLSLQTHKFLGIP